MFIGRETELKKLNEMHDGGKFECVIVYGRRRVGKTTLIKEFIKDKKAIYFVAREAGGTVNLNGFSNDVYSVTAKELVKNAFFSDWENAFDYIHQISKDDRIVLAIDEYPFLAEAYRPISSILQAHIDARFKDGKLFLILCGSSMSFMENQVLGYKSPLYGRRTAQFKILPFGFFESLPFLEPFPKEDKAILYGVTGGIPEYLNKIDAAKSVSENIKDLFLTASGPLFEEPANLLKQELREPAIYNGIIEAIAGGASRLNEISTKCGMESNKCAKYLKSLMSLGIVKKELPVTEASSKRSIYILNDMMFRFWYRFVFSNMSGIVSGLGGAIFDFEIEEELSAYMGPVFEEICKQYLIERAKGNELPFPPGKIGRWWGNNPREKRREEIDLLSCRKDSALFCECKWTNARVDAGTLAALTKKSELFHCKHTWLWLFAKNGFTNRLIREADGRSNVRLVRFEDMF
ncbi:MAG: ATP-binding protein [Clostridiales Family XIII bacterium]|jgi:AAA+ ATPase superfamily predicted ATPase|nr:ATP-binding protein [Clostridiales Family XIII bacterium]